MDSENFRKTEAMARSEGAARRVNPTTQPASSADPVPASCPTMLPMGRALFRVMRAIMFEESPVPELDALPLAQLRLFWTIHYLPDGTMKDFSERLGVSQSTVTQLADRLVRRGLVDRHADAEDRRVVRLRASESGRQILGKVKTQQDRTLNAVWDAMMDGEQQSVLNGLDILGKTAEAVRVAQGRPLPPLPEKFGEPVAAGEETSPTQPVVDLMARRVRGRTSS